MIGHEYIALQILQFNKKNIAKIDENGKITIKPQLLRSMSTILEWREGSLSTKEVLKEDYTINMTNKMSRMSFKFARNSVDQSITTKKSSFYQQGLYIGIGVFSVGKTQCQQVNICH